ncbi:MAG: hypothetical protein RIT27_1301 [Pseudomonadota bacterium]|jgi:phosphatidate cytidylyltransferase
MLLQRIITGLILAAMSLVAIFYLDTEELTLFIGVFVTLAAWEWSRLANCEKRWQQILYAAFVGLLPFLTFASFILSLYSNIAILQNIGFFTAYFVLILYAFFFVSSPLIWTVALLKLVAYQRDKDPKIGFKCLLGFWLLSAAWIALALLREMGVEWLLYLFGLVWIADIGAFFVGRAFGKHKLADKISPGKTIEGVLGAMLFGGAFSLGFALWKTDEITSIFVFVGLAIVTVIFSIIGDLLESLFKRQKGVKDSSQLLPGHGGFLDRLDSIIAAAPVFLVGLLILKEMHLLTFLNYVD